MKKAILFTIFTVTFFTGQLAFACGGVFYACGKPDVLAHGNDFYQNCSEGDRIQVVDLCHPAETGYTFCLQNGPCNEY